MRRKRRIMRIVMKQRQRKHQAEIMDVEEYHRRIMMVAMLDQSLNEETSTRH